MDFKSLCVFYVGSISTFFAKIQNFYCLTEHTNTTPTSILYYLLEVNHILVGNIYWPFWPPVQVIKKCDQKVVLLRPFWFWFKSKIYHTVLGKWQSTRSIYKVKIYTYNILHSLGLKSFDMFFNADLLQFDRSIVL